MEEISYELTADRDEFRPYIYVQSEHHRPSFITGAALSAMRMKYLQVPAEITALPLDEQLPHIQAMIRRHYREQRGECLLFGRITGYIYRWAAEESIAFATDGSIVDPEHGRFMEDGVARAYIKRRPIRLVDGEEQGGA